MTRALKAFLFLVFFTLYSQGLFALEDKKLVNLSKQIIEAKTQAGLYAPFEQLKEAYFSENKYSDYVDFLKSLSAKKDIAEPFINYYIALSRYSQLKYLQEQQVWEEYFAKGNDYRDELTKDAQKAIDATNSQDPLNIYSRLVLWQFHSDEQDNLTDSSLEGLMNSVLEYSKSVKEPRLVKEAADKLSGHGEKSKSRQLYKIYADKIISSDITDETLAASALGFYKEGNLELAQMFYDYYIDRITKTGEKEKLISTLKDLARDFSYSPAGQNEALKDSAYAEKLFEKMKEAGGERVFDEELMYMRALNLEKSKEYAKAKDAYQNLLKQYNGTKYADEVNFKLAIIDTYILRDINSARLAFEALAGKENISSQVISSLYQLGLLTQWEEKNEKAKEYYNKLLEKAGASFAQTAALAKERLKEIEESKPLEYNLKTFLDLSLKEENKEFEMTKLDLKYIIKQGEAVNIISNVYTAASGCMEVQLQYLWSQDLGGKIPSASQASFEASYADKGTKVIGLVVVSPEGFIDRSITIVDVH